MVIAFVFVAMVGIKRDVCLVLMVTQEMSVHKAAAGQGLEAKDAGAVEAEAQRSRLPSVAVEEEVVGGDAS